jgi:hypothetical protein
MSNWELSTQRANEARHIFESQGLSADKVFMIRGYADRKPLFEDTADPRNRRISMLLLSPDGLKIAQGNIARQGDMNRPELGRTDGPTPLIISDPAQTKPIAVVAGRRGGLQ